MRADTVPVHTDSTTPASRSAVACSVGTTTWVPQAWCPACVPSRCPWPGCPCTLCSAAVTSADTVYSHLRMLFWIEPVRAPTWSGVAGNRGEQTRGRPSWLMLLSADSCGAAKLQSTHLSMCCFCFCALCSSMSLVAGAPSLLSRPPAPSPSYVAWVTGHVQCVVGAVQCTQERPGVVRGQGRSAGSGAQAGRSVAG